MLQSYRERERLAREAVRKAVKNLPWLFSEEGSQSEEGRRLAKEASQRFYRARMEQESIEKLVGLAREGDKDALEILLKRGRDARDTGASVPECFHEFVWELALDGPPKAKPGTSPKDMGLRDLIIAKLVDMVNRDYGFPEYRNIEYRGQETGPMSACLLVAEELGLKERRVEEIWAERKDMIRRHQHGPC
jgi:hypothetical protein